TPKTARRTASNLMFRNLVSRVLLMAQRTTLERGPGGGSLASAARRGLLLSMTPLCRRARGSLGSNIEHLVEGHRSLYKSGGSSGGFLPPGVEAGRAAACLGGR